jgi:hypothetical protein
MDHDRVSRAKRHKPPNVKAIDEIWVGMFEDEFRPLTKPQVGRKGGPASEGRYGLAGPPQATKTRGFRWSGDD